MNPYWMALPVVLASWGCDRGVDCVESDEIPTDAFECAQRVDTVGVGECVGPDDGPQAQMLDVPSISIDDGEVTVRVRNAVFRDNNEVCAYYERAGKKLTVLFQPCTLIHEGGVSTGDCWLSEVIASDPGMRNEGIESVSILKRVDAPESVPPYTPTELGPLPLEE